MSHILLSHRTMMLLDLPKITKVKVPLVVSKKFLQAIAAVSLLRKLKVVCDILFILLSTRTHVRTFHSAKQSNRRRRGLKPL